MPYNREEQLDHALRWLRERSGSDSQTLTADQAEDVREYLYGVRVGLIEPANRLTPEKRRQALEIKWEDGMDTDLMNSNS